ncbi:DNA mismatch repair endonuclease MutL [Pigmentibacter sp. JX0631]|uniref:DNA mismatch repair endonuclease MutL n=1 Tax=Pigmentibacter sp. JX0631 TaxID=2976982 RepID=UPI00246953C9|nr:DNA mismatch repair endonuclease MutL [Pigmentibacter sp. JX0631]WGL59616.1 DNA mismatch repair endonuclease MutL [Pigmentibacter sp. JX0631]
MQFDIIKKLPEHLINQIKAGEVVERPYNVVKELVENSIDACAKNIFIELLDGGKQLIKITDDGKGIPASQLSIAVERHATSKINKFTDLENLTSFGFRGEALPSIASVSNFTLRSRIQEEDYGSELIINYGEKNSIKNVSMPKGTVVQVKEIFKNVPVRLKFLKSTATEFAHIHDFITAMAFCNPNIAFKLMHNGREVSNFVQKKTFLERFSDIIGVEKSNFIQLDFKRGSFELTGFVGKPELGKSVPSHFITFVNGRYVKDKVIRSGILQGYQGLLLKGLVAPAIIFVTVDPSWIDVNVHPSKTEIRFYDTLAVQEFISIAVQDQIKNGIKEKKAPDILEKSIKLEEKYIKSDDYSSIFKISKSEENPKFNQEKYFQKPNYQSHIKGSEVAKLKMPVSESKPKIIENSSNISQPDKSLNLSSKDEKFIPFISSSREKFNPFANAKYLGQFDNCYILLEFEKELWFLDQHAFHERILYEEILSSHKASKTPRQELLAPIIIPSQEILSDIIMENKGKILSLGFEIEKLKNSHIAIHSFPSFLNVQKIPDIFDEIITRIVAVNGLPQGEIYPIFEKISKFTAGIQEELNRIPSQLNDEDLFHLLFATMACHSAIRAGDPLNFELVQRLLQRASDVDFYSHCPHGRPVIRKFTSKDVSSWFLRT